MISHTNQSSTEKVNIKARGKGDKKDLLERTSRSRSNTRWKTHENWSKIDRRRMKDHWKIRKQRYTRAQRDPTKVQTPYIKSILFLRASNVFSKYSYIQNSASMVYRSKGIRSDGCLKRRVLCQVTLTVDAMTPV